MRSRATILLTALVLCLGMASGAKSENWKVSRVQDKSGFAVLKVTFEPGDVDTANHVGLDVATKVNDSLMFYSPGFTVPQPWTICAVRCFWETQDAVTTSDTIGYDLQWKFSDSHDSTWNTAASCAKADEDLINTNPATADLKAYAHADSVWIGDYLRLKVALIAEEATWRGADVSGILEFNAKYGFYLMFVDK